MTTATPKSDNWTTAEPQKQTDRLSRVQNHVSSLPFFLRLFPASIRVSLTKMKVREMWMQLRELGSTSRHRRRRTRPWRWGGLSDGTIGRIIFPSSYFNDQCLVVVMPSHSGAAQGTPDCQQRKLERLDGPAGESHPESHSTSLWKTSQRQDSSLDTVRWSCCRNGANQLWILSNTHTMNH